MKQSSSDELEDSINIGTDSEDIEKTPHLPADSRSSESSPEDNYAPI